MTGLVSFDELKTTLKANLRSLRLERENEVVGRDFNSTPQYVINSTMVKALLSIVEIVETLNVQVQVNDKVQESTGSALLDQFYNKQKSSDPCGPGRKITTENIRHIIKVFLAGRTSYLKNKPIICDSSPQEHPPNTWCEWEQVIDRRDEILRWLDAADTNEMQDLGRTLRDIWNKSD